MSGSRWVWTWLARWNGAVQIMLGLAYLSVHFFGDGFRRPTLTLVLGLLFIVLGTGSLITRVRGDRRSRPQEHPSHTHTPPRKDSTVNPATTRHTNSEDG